VRAITLDPTYEVKTAEVVLTRENGTLKMSVYRMSTSPDALRLLSREDFMRTPQGLNRLAKEREVPAARRAPSTWSNGKSTHTRRIRLMIPS
jgi:hypothetical protein